MSMLMPGISPEEYQGWSCPICNDLDPACLMVTCEERARAAFRRLSDREIRRRQDLCTQQLALAGNRESITVRLQTTERLLTEAMLERLPA